MSDTPSASPAATTEDADDSSAAAATWLKARWTPGNWFAIGPEDEIPPFITGWGRTLVHMFQIAFTPEIERRVRAGNLPDSFFLQTAQLLQPPDGGRIVRFNDEVRGIIRLRRESPLPEDAQLRVSDLDDLDAFDLIAEELDSGHFTAFFTGTGWRAVFDFRAGRAKAASLIARAREFAAAARFAVDNAYAGAATDNLFSACELLAKVKLMLTHSPAAKAKTHGPVGSAINAWGRLGNVDGDFVALFNRMSALRTQARYDAAKDMMSPTSADLELIERMAERLTFDVAPRVS